MLFSVLNYMASSKGAIVMFVFGIESIVLLAVITLVLVVNNGRFGCASRLK